jgi:DNA polymerase (family 10)
MPDNGAIAESFQLLGDLLQLEGADRHRVLAYHRAAARARDEARPLAELALAGRATEIADIGKTLQAKIAELAETGQIAALEKARERTPEGLVDVAQLRGLGPKRAMAAHDALGVASLEDLSQALHDGRLADVPGFGKGTVESIGEQLAERAMRSAATGDRIPLGRGLVIARRLCRELANAPGVVSVEIAGSLRRGRETAHDIDLIASEEWPGAAAEALGAEPGSVGEDGVTHARAKSGDGTWIELIAGPRESHGNRLQHATGSAAHNVRLRERAVKLGLSVSQHGIVDEDGERHIHADEAGVYGALGLPDIPPELREDRGEIEAALSGGLPRLVEIADLRGDLHIHTNWSDGRDSLEQMVEGAKARGYSYVAISDHSPRLRMARGLDEERLRAQWEDIVEARERHPEITILRASEVDIVADGLDFEDDVLAELDFVTASLHSGFSLSGRELTERVLRAIRSPHVDSIGHPTGRMLGKRDAAPLDIVAIAEEAAATGTTLEVNGQLNRLDLDADNAKIALDAGATLILSSDAHSVSGLDFIENSVLVARRAGATPGRVLNTTGDLGGRIP